MSRSPSAEGASGQHAAVGVSGPDGKPRRSLPLPLFDLMKGVDGTQMQLDLQVGHLFQLKAFLLPGQSRKKYQLRPEERRFHHF